MARKRSEKGGYATRASPASAFVVRQQTQQGHWLRLRVTLASYNTSSGRLILCLNNVLDYEPTDQSQHNIASTSRALDAQIYAPFTDSASTPQTTTGHCEEMLLAQTVESPTTTTKLQTASQLAESSSLADVPETKVTPLSRCWVTSSDVQLAWAAGSFDIPATDRECSWHVNGKRSNSHVAIKPCNQRQAPDNFIGCQGDNCHELQQLLNCDSSYMISTHQSTHVTSQPAYVDLITLADRNTVVYGN